MGKTKESKKTPKKTKIKQETKDDIFKIKQDDILNFWMDTIECFWELKNKSDYFFKHVLTPWELDFDDWYKVADDIDIEYSTKPSKYLYKISFKKDWVLCLAYYEWTMTSANIKTRNLYTVYWKWWRLLWKKRVYELLDQLFVFTWFRRLDLSCDLLLPIEQVLSSFKKLTQKWADLYWDRGTTETHYIWDYKKANNKYMLIRIYDKLKEIRHEKTQHLYTDYLLHEHVTRIEIVFREETSKNIKWSEAIDKENYSFNLFCTKLEKHTKIFSELQNKKITLKRDSKSVDLSELNPEQILDSNYLKVFKWYARNLLSVWICPIHLLLLSNQYDSNTMQDIIYSQIEWEFNLNEYKTGLNYRNVRSIFKN